MLTKIKTITAITTGLFFALAVNTASAKLYKYVDEHGITRYSDSVPGKHSKYGRSEINSNGVITNRTKRKLTEKERKELEQERIRKEVEAAKIAKENAKKRRKELDLQILKARFSDEEMLEKERAARISTENASITIIQKRVDNYKEKRKNLINSAIIHEKSRGNIPVDIYKSIDEKQSEIKKDEKTIKRKKEEIAQINAKFDDYHKILFEKK